ncbi:MAG: CHAT domain-containing protein [Waterburya sp.]
MQIFPPLRRKLQPIHLLQSIIQTSIQQIQRTAVYPQEYLTFLQEVLLTTAASNSNPEVVYPLLQNNLDKLDETFAEILYQWGIDTLPTLESEQAYEVTRVIFGFSALIQQFPFGNRRSNLEMVINGYQAVGSVFTREAFPYQWAGTMNNLALAYSDRIRGERGENLEQAIATHSQALEVVTRTAMPMEWARTMMNLANSYSNRIRGERGENIEQAIVAFSQALEVFNRKAFPSEWAGTMYNLALAYANRIRGERAENIERAIVAFSQALEVRTRTAMPVDWATTMNNLAIAYFKRIRGERAENIEQAIAAYSQALEVRTRTAMPVDWATTMNNLANSYRSRIRGERAENIERAIAISKQALEVFTRTAMPVEWARTMMNLAIAYSDRIRGERVENIERAIAAFSQVLEVFTRTAMPVEWALTMYNLASAYSKRIRGERAENIERAITAFSQALEVRTRTAMPVDWAQTMCDLAAAYANRIRGERAENIERAIAALKQGREVITRTAMPVEWAGTMWSLAIAYSDRIRGERGENIEQAIAAYSQALEVFRPEALPVECRRAAGLLGNLYAENNYWSEATEQYQLALEAVEVLYEQSLSLTGKEDELAETGDLFHRTAYALVRAGHLKSAVVTLERGRARNLSETLARDRADLERVKFLAPDIYESYQQAAILLRNLEAQERIRSTLEAKNQVTVTPEGIRQQTLEARQKLNKTIEQIRQISGYENFLTSPTFEEISRALKPDEPLIYLTTTEYGTISLLVNRTSTNNASVVSLRLDTLTDAELRELLGGAEEETELMGSFPADNNHLDNRQAWLDTIDRVTNELWSKLMGAVINHLKLMKMQQAILIPTGLLGVLPLHAAWTEDLEKPCGRRYALDEISLTYAPNARSLITAGEIATNISQNALLAVDEPRPVKANELPNSEREVQTAIETFPHHRIFKHEQATQQAVKNALSDYSVWHFSCHGYANFTEPLDSGLLMANNQILSLRDLLDLSLDGVRLAVLSACETALPGGKLIDEVVSLPTEMLQAGVAGVAASLWSVADISTMILMARFYELWRHEGLKPSEALRQAQQWVRDTTNGEKVAYFENFLPAFSTNRMTTSVADALWNELILEDSEDNYFAHPFHWAAFTYTGV